jgi:hypothetical protein
MTKVQEPMIVLTLDQAKVALVLRLRALMRAHGEVV